MSGFWAMARRELSVYFVSPMAYIVLTGLLFLSGFAFVGGIQYAAENKLPADFLQTFMLIVWVLVMASPLVTMRLIAEEKSRGTLEIAMTAPVTELQFVLAKFFAALLFLLYLLVPTAGYAVIVSQYGQVDFGAVATGYVGVFLVGAAIYSVGLFISALCSNQITAAMVTFVLAFLIFLANMFGGGLSADSVWRELLQFVDLSYNVMDFCKGVIDTRRLVYLLSMIVFFVFLTVRVVESRRWR